MTASARAAVAAGPSGLTPQYILMASSSSALKERVRELLDMGGCPRWSGDQGDLEIGRDRRVPVVDDGGVHQVQELPTLAGERQRRQRAFSTRTACLCFCFCRGASLFWGFLLLRLRSVMSVAFFKKKRAKTAFEDSTHIFCDPSTAP